MVIWDDGGALCVCGPGSSEICTVARLVISQLAVRVCQWPWSSQYSSWMLCNCSAANLLTVRAIWAWFILYDPQSSTGTHDVPSLHVSQLGATRLASLCLGPPAGSSSSNLLERYGSRDACLEYISPDLLHGRLRICSQNWRTSLHQFLPVKSGFFERRQRAFNGKGRISLNSSGSARNVGKFSRGEVSRIVAFSWPTGTQPLTIAVYSSIITK